MLVDFCKRTLVDWIGTKSLPKLNFSEVIIDDVIVLYPVQLCLLHPVISWSGWTDWLDGQTELPLILSINLFYSLLLEFVIVLFHGGWINPLPVESVILDFISFLLYRRSSLCVKCSAKAWYVFWILSVKCKGLMRLLTLLILHHVVNAIIRVWEATIWARSLNSLASVFRRTLFCNLKVWSGLFNISADCWIYLFHI